jgi:polyhydroxybutyrate depolymerase
VRPEWLLPLALLFGLGSPETPAASTPCLAAPAAGSQQLTLTVDHASRALLVHVPPGIAAGERVPLLLALHGYRGSGPQMEHYSGLSRIADRAGFIVAYPSSEGTYWNSTAAKGLPDDVRFLSRSVAYLKHRFCLDPGRVFATGVSNGGGMVALAACRLSAQIDAIASVAGGYDEQPPCHPARPVSVLEIHGTADQVVNYFGRSGRRTRDGLPPFVNGWVRRDRCSGAPRAHRIATRTTRFLWSDCAGGVTVEHIRVSGGRHQWPGATPPDPGPNTICASCVVWSFFSHLRSGSRRFAAGGTSGGSGL